MSVNAQEKLEPVLGAALDILRQNGDFRVWSVIVTLFGDLAQAPGDRISGALLSTLTARIGIRPEAMRVALHRLRKDGWIISERTGRTSSYRLSGKGFAESLAARKRIYAPSVETPKSWRLIVTPPMSSIERAKHDRNIALHGALMVAPGVYLSAMPPPMPAPDLLTVSGNLEPPPDWIKSIAAPKELTDQYRNLVAVFDRLSILLMTRSPNLPHDIAALRILIIHKWRRLALRHALLPSFFYPVDWPGLVCRQQVSEVLAHLSRPELANLQD